MEQSALACSVVSSVATKYVECPVCDRAYQIMAHKHFCGPISCQADRVKYSDEYIDKLSTEAAEAEESILRAACDKCKEDERKKTTARHGRCPKCEYVGWYIQDDTRLCPVCKVPPVNSAPKKQATLKDAPQRARKMIAHLENTMVSLYDEQDIVAGEPKREIYLMNWGKRNAYDALCAATEGYTLVWKYDSFRIFVKFAAEYKRQGFTRDLNFGL